MAKETLKGLGERLKEARVRMQPEVYLKDAGKIVGRSGACVGMWEAGNTEPSFTDLFKLAEFYGVPVNWLLGVSDAGAPGLLQASSKSVPLLGNTTIASGGRATARYIDAAREYSDAFAWTVDTDAMNRCASGDMAVVERDSSPIHNAIYLIVSPGGDSPTLRRCQRDQGRVFFVADTQGFQTFSADDVQVVGRVREIIKHVLLD